METISSGSGRRLKILCLHGMNNNIESFRYMTAGFTQLFGALCSFVFIEAPHNLDPEVIPPEVALVNLGFKPPFKTWFKSTELTEDVLRLKEDYEKARPLPPGDEYWISCGTDESVEVIMTALRKDRFDGILTFSQG
jgi:hypothetical protein